jgi:glycosyltransferase involved in cell wall biosynthesis
MTTIWRERSGPRSESSSVGLRTMLRLARAYVERGVLFVCLRHVIRNPYVAGRVSVVTSTYDRPNVLRDAIDSVRRQTYRDWEHIVVSDGPDERVDALVAAYDDPRIRAYHTRRVGWWGNHQRNYALKFATGEFVLFVDDDNVIYPNCLETMVRGFSSPEIGYVVCPVRYGEDWILAPTPEFRVGEIDLLNYMARRRLVERVWGQGLRHWADFRVIDRIRRLSPGRFVDVIIGHHR